MSANSDDVADFQRWAERERARERASGGGLMNRPPPISISAEDRGHLRELRRDPPAPTVHLGGRRSGKTAAAKALRDAAVRADKLTPGLRKSYRSLRHDHRPDMLPGFAEWLPDQPMKLSPAALAILRHRPDPVPFKPRGLAALGCGLSVHQVIDPPPRYVIGVDNGTGEERTCVLVRDDHQGTLTVVDEWQTQHVGKVGLGLSEAWEAEEENLRDGLRRALKRSMYRPDDREPVP